MRDIRFLLKPYYSESRALIIGIDEYAGKNINNLSYAVSDAEEVRDTLISEFSFSKDKITFLTNDDATKERILSLYLKLTSVEVDLDERIVVFFAGHGHTRPGIRGEVGYLVPYNADLNDYSTLIRWSEFTENSELIRAKHILFIMDACYGGLALTRSIGAGSTRFLNDMLLRFSRQVLTAGKADETVADSGGPLPNHSIFTGHLIEGMRGGAATEHGIITANGLMSYVYSKVSSDKNSNQTPHHGHFDGDGDCILKAPKILELQEEDRKDIDNLIAVPYSGGDDSLDSIENKIIKLKMLLSHESSTIELHDYIVDELRRYLVNTSEDQFKVQGNYSLEEFVDRVSRYETNIIDLALMCACVAYWAKPIHKPLLQKIFSRSADRLESKGGTVVWLNLRWYPLIVELYCAGIASVDGNRYDCLREIFYTGVGSTDFRHGQEFFVEGVSRAIKELDVFKQLPGYEKKYTPLSEYLFKTLQPKLDDLLFIGKNYEKSFDEFELMLALVVADINSQRGEMAWPPIGRFGWKVRRLEDAPLSKMIKEANAMLENWEPLKQGLFGGKFDRFEKVSSELQNKISQLNWW